MSRKNHINVDGRLIQTDKPFSQLKATQKEKISEWLYQEYAKVYQSIGLPPDTRRNDTILSAVYEKIEQAEIWIPLGEVRKYFYRHKTKYKNRYEKSLLKENGIPCRQ
jgi:hypothetical protein